uniref:Uncharacterized protein n=1 Tax=viral metagenome TaxID=1070528 RepID=A0A6C0JJ43_9ZZZZ
MDQLVFTRYLYPRINVRESLLLALLDRNTNEALFWAYEYYFSGFKEGAWAYLESIYENFYKKENPELESKLFALERNDLLIGSIVSTLSTRNYQVNSFVKTYYSKKIRPIIYANSKFKFIVSFKESELDAYRTVLPDKDKPRLYLPSVCKYNIRNNCRDLFSTPYSDIKTELFYQWIFYASRSSIWLERIEDLGGKVNEEKEQVDFPNEELMEAFYDIWGIEPDEQPKEIIERCIGNSTAVQLSIDDFCEKYGGIIKILKNTIKLNGK